MHATGLVSHICDETWRSMGDGPQVTHPTGYLDSAVAVEVLRLFGALRAGFGRVPS